MPETPVTEIPHEEETNIPALMRWARGSYGQAVGRSLAIAGYDDLPRNGAFVLGGMANLGGSAADMIRGLGVTKQAASQLIDTLVLRGYLTREVDADDRRRLTISVTERGRGAAEAVRGAVESIDAELEAAITPAELAGLRAGLNALARINRRQAEHEHHHSHDD